MIPKKSKGIWIIFILLTPIFTFIMALREYKHIKTVMVGIDATYLDVLKCHFQSHFELIKYWDESIIKNGK